MEQYTAFVSNDGNKRVKLEYVRQGEQLVRLWELHKDKALETTFDNNGAILNQIVLKPDTELLNHRLQQSLLEANISKTEQKRFTDIKFERPCPKCGEKRLSRYAEAFASKAEVPVMPMYQCQNCSTKSYHMTDKYLECLVESNSEMFSEAEIAELNTNRVAFMNELKGYIIRIFASKKIMNIK